MDEIIECSMSVDEASNIISITGLVVDSFDIDYSSDIDFTDFVSKLTEKIDRLQHINITIDNEPTNEKIKLVTDTIKEIFHAYNASINIEQEIEE